jgi:hypothetical protein
MKSEQNITIQTVNTGLTVKERETINDLPSGLQIYVKAKDSPKIFEMSPADAEIMIYNLISETQINIGHTKSAEDSKINQISAAAILQYIHQKYRTLTVAELKLAFLNGLSGDYGDYIGINLKTASQWIRGYSGAEIKRKALSEWNKHLDTDKKEELSEEQKEEIELRSAVNYFEEFKQNSNSLTPDFILAIYYMRLKQKGLINFSDDKKSEMYEIAIKELKHGHYSRLEPRDIYGAMISKIEKQQNKQFDNICKRIALHEYFKELVNKGIELKDVLKK